MYFTASACLGQGAGNSCPLYRASFEQNLPDSPQLYPPVSPLKGPTLALGVGHQSQQVDPMEVGPVVDGVNHFIGHWNGPVRDAFKYQVARRLLMKPDLKINGHRRQPVEHL